MSRSSVAKWPDIGATTQHARLTGHDGFRKWIRVANGVVQTASS